MRDEESTLSCATVRVESLSVEQFVIDTDILIIDSAIEGEGDHHGKVGDLQFATLHTGGSGAVSRAETIGQQALSRVARISLRQKKGYSFSL